MSAQEYDYTSLQKTVEELLPEAGRISVEKLITQLAAGEFGNFREWISELGNWLLGSVTVPAEHGIRMLFLVLFSALFSNLSRAFQKNGASQMGFLCVYLLMALHAASGFFLCLETVRTGVEQICSLTSVLLPTYCLSIAFVTGSLTAAGYYQGTAFLITLLQYVTAVVLLPLSQSYLLLSFASCMQREPVFEKLLHLILSVFSWIKKTLTGIVIAFGSVQGIVCPAIDRVKKNAVMKTASAIPGVGDLVDGAWETVMGAGVVLKNSIGMAGVILLVLVCALPLCNLGIYYLFYRLIGAVTEPITQNSTEVFLMHAGNAQKLLLDTLMTSMFLFLILLVIMTRISV